MQPNFPKCYKISSKPHKYCPGCGHPIVLRSLGEAIDELKISDKVIFLIDIGCSLLAWDYFDLPTSQTHHGRTLPTAVGFKMADPHKIVIAYVGDGGAYAIGLQHAVTTCLRNDPITTIVVNNTVYGMTGGQMAPTTIDNEITATSPYGKTPQMAATLKGPEMLSTIAKPGAYLARATVAQPITLKNYLKKAILNQLNNHNFSLVEVLSACPTNWQTNAVETLQYLDNLGKIFPLGEFK